MKEFDAKQEKKALEEIVRQIPADKNRLVRGLIADASFMAEQLEKLRNTISEKGVSETYQHGANQYGNKTTAEAEMYIKMQKSYSSVIRQLTDLLPAKPGPSNDELLEFLGTH